MRKLKSRAQFEAALNSQVIARSEHFALHRLLKSGFPESDPFLSASPQQGAAQKKAQNMGGCAQLPLSVERTMGPVFAVLVPKRWASRAVTRNMIKRQARAMAQRALPRQEDSIFLLRLRRAWPQQAFIAATSPAWAGEVRRQLSALFSSLEPQA